MNKNLHFSLQKASPSAWLNNATVMPKITALLAAGITSSNHISSNSFFMQTSNRSLKASFKVIAMIVLIMVVFVGGASAQEARSFQQGAGKTTTLVPKKNTDNTWSYEIRVNNTLVYNAGTMSGSKTGYPTIASLEKVLTAVQFALRTQSHNPAEMTLSDLKTLIEKAEISAQ